MFVFRLLSDRCENELTSGLRISKYWRVAFMERPYIHHRLKVKAAWARTFSLAANFVMSLNNADVIDIGTLQTANQAAKRDKLCLISSVCTDGALSQWFSCIRWVKYSPSVRWPYAVTLLAYSYSITWFHWWNMTIWMLGNTQYTLFDCWNKIWQWQSFITIILVHQ